jgi:hypothetical protein
MNKNWHGIMKLLEVSKLDCFGNIVYQQKNILNMLHNTGEQYIINSAFISSKADNFYFGLDARATIAAEDTMVTITNNGNEPTINGYSRVMVSGSGGFTLGVASGVYLAQGPVVSFSATGGSWGPVKNLFLTTKSDNTGILIASAALSENTILNSGETLNVRLALTLKDITV